MPLRFFNRRKLAPGLSLNLTKHGGSLSIGPPGAKYTFGTAGTRRTVGIPGTGLYYTERGGGGKSHDGRRAERRTESEPARSRLDLGFFQRLITPPGEKHFVDGMRALIKGDESGALNNLTQDCEPADVAFMAGILSLKREHTEDALKYLAHAGSQSDQLGTLFHKYGVTATVSLPITSHISAEIEPSVLGINLALAEARQLRNDPEAALACLEKIHDKAPDDPVIHLSMAEILVSVVATPEACKRVIKLVGDVDNTDAIRAGVCYWKGRALHTLGLNTAARDALSLAFRRKKGRDPDFLLAVQYARACVYQDLGDKNRVRQEFERIYASDPDYEDVARRLGQT